MKIEKTKLDGVVVITPDVFGDHRGFFMESWSQKKMEEAGLFYNFVQDNHSSYNMYVSQSRHAHNTYFVLS